MIDIVYYAIPILMQKNSPKKQDTQPSKNGQLSVQFNLGFGGREFLTESEWNTFRRRKPVRYIRKELDDICSVCGLPPDADNPFQNAHRIGFEAGIIFLGLTPEYVDSHENIVTSHRIKCNNASELDLTEVMRLLKERGIKSLPTYLPQEIHQLWESVED